MKTIKNLTKDQREILGGAAVMVAGIAFLFWLTTTVSRPVMDHPSIDQQIYHEKSYELPASLISTSTMFTTINTITND